MFIIITTNLDEFFCYEGVKLINKSWLSDLIVGSHLVQSGEGVVGVAGIPVGEWGWHGIRGDEEARGGRGGWWRWSADGVV